MSTLRTYSFMIPFHQFHPRLVKYNSSFIFFFLKKYHIWERERETETNRHQDSLSSHFPPCSLGAWEVEKRADQRESFSFFQISTHRRRSRFVGWRMGRGVSTKPKIVIHAYSQSTSLLAATLPIQKQRVKTANLPPFNPTLFKSEMDGRKLFGFWALPLFSFVKLFFIKNFLHYGTTCRNLFIFKFVIEICWKKAVTLNL